MIEGNIAERETRDLEAAKPPSDQNLCQLRTALGQDLAVDQRAPAAEIGSAFPVLHIRLAHRCQNNSPNPSSLTAESLLGFVGILSGRVHLFSRRCA
jgi:hypothetical protein